MEKKKLIRDDMYQQLSSLTFVDNTCFGELATIISIGDNLFTHVNLEIYLRNDKEKLSSIDICLSNSNIQIMDFKSKYENQGIGKLLLKKFDFIVSTYLKCNGFSYITGMLSYRDYVRWDKLLYLYCTYITNRKIIIDSKYEPRQFLKFKHKYKEKNVHFKLFL